MRRLILNASVGWLGPALLIVWLSGGCQSTGQYHQEADRVAYRIIEAAQTEALGQTEPFTIEKPSQTLRRRLLMIQSLPFCGPAALGVDKLDPLDHWPDDQVLVRPDRQTPPILNPEPDTPLQLTLDEALQVAAANSRDYQTRKESVFLTALSLDLARDAFRNTYIGLLSSTFAQDLPGDDGTLANTADLSASRRLQNGISLTSRIALDLAALLMPDRDASLGILADFSATVPLISGAGEHIVREPLTQAERDVLYSLWEFERYKRTFAVRVASDYLSVVQRLDEVTNAANNYRRLIEAAERARALAEEGRLPEIQVDQARSDELRARDRWISAQASYQRQLDAFKVSVGLPADAKITLDSAALQRLADAAQQALAEAVAEDAPEFRVAEDDRIELLQPTSEGAGPYELAESRAIQLAFTNRLDLRVALASVTDAMRQVVVDADDLKPGLALSANYSAGQRRGAGSARSDNAELRPEHGQYSIGLEFDFPWEKVAERNTYRSTIISLERSVRDVQDLEDRIKTDLRDGLRTLVSAREGIRIQAQAVEVAQRRVESTRLFFDLGRAAIRDVLEAQEALVQAQNALTNALVSYRVTELELQRDMGVLDVDEKGLWREYRPNG